VAVNLHGEVRCDVQLLRLGDGGELEELGDPADAGSIRLDDVCRAGVDQAYMLGDAGQHLTGRDRCIQRASQVGVALGVVRVQRLLDPDQTELLEDAPHPLRGRSIPLLIRVDHQRDAVVEELADLRHSDHVGAPIRLADLELDATDARLQRCGGVLTDLLDRGVQESTGGVVSAHRVPVGPEELGERQPGALGLQIPECDVEGRDRLGRQTAAAHRCTGPAELHPQLADVTRVLADQHLGDLLGVGELAGAAGSLGVGETDTLAALLGRHLDHQECDLGHRLLPSGEHLGVADRCAERQGDAGDLQVGDPITCRGSCGAGDPRGVRRGQGTGRRRRCLGRHVGSSLTGQWWSVRGQARSARSEVWASAS
jgi:hypothetical protein